MIVEIGNDKFLKITWGSAGAVIAALVSVILWLSSVDSRATTASQRLDRQADSLKEMRGSIIDIDKRTIRIETILNEMKLKQRGF